jgi:hypothetical protein
MSELIPWLRHRPHAAFVTIRDNLPDRRFKAGICLDTAPCRCGFWMASPAPAMRVLGCLFLDRLCVIKVAFRLYQQEEVFVCSGGPIFHAFGHDVGFMPDDRASEVIPIAAQGKRQHPGYPDQVLGLETGRGSRSFRAPWLSWVPRGVSWVVGGAPAAGVTISDVEPECSIRAQHAPHLAKHPHQLANVALSATTYRLEVLP